MSSKSGKKKHKAPAREPFVAGWMYWLIVFVVLLAPAVALTWILRTSDATLGQSLGVAAVIAALGAGIIAWATNTVLDLIRKRSSKPRKAK